MRFLGFDYFEVLKFPSSQILLQINTDENREKSRVGVSRKTRYEVRIPGQRETLKYLVAINALLSFSRQKCIIPQHPQNKKLNIISVHFFVSETAMGVQINAMSQKDSEYVKALYG